MSFLEEWLDFMEDCAYHEGVGYTGSRKIIRGLTWKVPGSTFFDGSLLIHHTGYEGIAKVRHLSKFYYNKDDTERALRVFTKKIVDKRKHGSVGILTRAGDKGELRQDHCIQSVVVGYYPIPRGQHVCEVDIFYRGTESPKKFGADLVYFREVQLDLFRRTFDDYPVRSITFHFAAMTYHPMFMPVLFPWMSWDRIRMMFNYIRRTDPRLFGYLIGWLKRYYIDYDSGTQKYMQARRTKEHVDKYLKPKVRNKIIEYVELYL